MVDEKNIFMTDNLSLCPYLEMNGLKPLGGILDRGKGGGYKVFFQFEDPDNVGKDLEIGFRFSKEKRYRDLGFYYRSQIEKFRQELVKLNQKS